MNFEKDVSKVVGTEVFSSTPQLLILPCGMLCCVEMGFQEPRLHYSRCAPCLSIVSVSICCLPWWPFSRSLELLPAALVGDENRGASGSAWLPRKPHITTLASCTEVLGI